jgi:hypothetical protein
MKNLPSGKVGSFYSTDESALDYEGVGVEFRLTYEGPLLSDGKPAHKHALRKIFHSQLKRLWEIHPALKEWAAKPLLEKNYPLGPFKFLPLATGQFGNIVSLEVIYLRAGDPGKILQGYGDIDNRLKTLFDALSRPNMLNQLPTDESPADGEEPFYCLLEDDRLVGNVAVYSDMILEPLPGAERIETNDARLLINVRVATRLPLMFNPFV